MPESARHSTRPSESDFHDSQPLNSQKEHSIGDLSDIDKHSHKTGAASQLIGDIDQVESDAGSDVLGDITLLEEAFAEMEDGADEEMDVAGLEDILEDEDIDEELLADDDEPEIDDSDDDIPLLSESVAPPTSLSESQLALNEPVGDESIPLLDQQATVYENFNSNTEAANSDISSPISNVANSGLSYEEVIPLSELHQNPLSSLPESEIIGVEDNNNASDLQSRLEMDADDLSAHLAQMEDDMNADMDDLSLSQLSDAADEKSVAEMDKADAESSIISSPNSEHVSVSDIEREMTRETGYATSESVSIADENLSVEHNISSIASNEGYEAIDHIASDFDELGDSDMPDIGDLEINSEHLSAQSTLSGFSRLQTLASVDDKIAAATGETSIGIHEIPPNVHGSEIENIDLEKSDSISDFAAQLAESEVDITQGPAYINPSSMFSAFDSKLQEEEEAKLTSTTSIEHSVGIVGQDQPKFTLNIPFELHSQLSKKIDELVIDATTSLTNELQSHLAGRLESLLGNAVESVLPKIVDQMANELRNEVKGQVKQQLPNIINDVLGRTRLQK